MAEMRAGALPALPTGLSLADPDEKAKYNESIQKVLSALENRSSIPWFKMAAAFADPGALVRLQKVLVEAWAY